MDEENQPEPRPTVGSKESLYERKKVMREVSEDEKLPFTVHLEELRWRLIYCAITIGLTFVVLYTMSDALFDIIRKPIDVDLVFLAPTEAFFVYLKISIYFALILSMPMILYQMWMFTAPGLLGAERTYTGPFVIFGTIFFALGATFCYFVVLPLGLKFLIGYGGEGLTAMISVGNYISFIFKLMIAFGLVFEMPIVIIFLTKLGFVDPKALAAKRSYFIVGSFVIASILTPPDVFTQIIMAVPIIILFEISLIVSKYFIKPRKPVDDD